MSVYFIAQIQITKEKVYQKYLDSAQKIFEEFNGKYLAVDDHPMCLEGLWDENRVVLIEFPSREEFKAWYCSEAYQEILKHRLEGSMCDSILINGIE